MYGRGTARRVVGAATDVRAIVQVVKESEGVDSSETEADCDGDVALLVSEVCDENDGGEDRGDRSGLDGGSNEALDDTARRFSH